MPSLIQDLERVGGGVFVTKQGVDTRLGESDIWRAFEEPVIVWVHGKSITDTELEQLIEISKRFPKLHSFRFTNTQTQKFSVERLQELWPGIRVEATLQTS